MTPTHARRETGTGPGGALVPAAIVTRLSVEECRRRLQDKVGSAFLDFDGRSVRGRVNERGFDLRARGGYRQTHYHLRGRYQPDANGTRIALRWGMGDSDRWLVIPIGSLLWMSAFARSALEMPMWPYTHQARWYATMMMLLIPLATLAWVRARRREHGPLVRYLERLLEAQAVSEPGDGS